MHTTYLLQALNEARKGRGFCAPNPAVGAVVLNKAGVPIGQGYHRAYGDLHAEAEVLGRLSTTDTEGGTLYVTLEPCCHQGKTPPCVELIIQKRIAQVIYAIDDPNPLVSGKGVTFLRDQGVTCERVSLPEIQTFYQSYAHWHETKRPWVTAKLALSLDGKIAGKGGQPTQITGSEAHLLTHQFRKKSDAILTTIKSVIADDPKLNARLDGQYFNKKIYILDRELQLPLSAKIIKTSAAITLFYDEDDNKNQNASTNLSNRIHKLTNAGIQVLPFTTEEGHFNLEQVIGYVGEEGAHDLWIEAGGTLIQHLIKKRLLNRLLFYIAPKTLGSNALSAFSESFNLRHAKNIKWQQLGDDVLCDIYPS